MLNLLGWARDRLRERATVVDEAPAMLCVELGANVEVLAPEGSIIEPALTMEELRKAVVSSEWQVLPQPCAGFGAAAGECPSSEQQIPDFDRGLLEQC